MPSGFLLDTCILVHLVRGDEIGRRIQKSYNLRAFYTECLISVVTYGEATLMRLPWSGLQRKNERGILSLDLELADGATASGPRWSVSNRAAPLPDAEQGAVPSHRQRKRDRRGDRGRGDHFRHPGCCADHRCEGA